MALQAAWAPRGHLAVQAARLPQKRRHRARPMGVEDQAAARPVGRAAQEPAQRHRARQMLLGGPAAARPAGPAARERAQCYRARPIGGEGPAAARPAERAARDLAQHYRARLTLGECQAAARPAEVQAARAPQARLAPGASPAAAQQTPRRRCGRSPGPCRRHVAHSCSCTSPGLAGIRTQCSLRKQVACSPCLDAMCETRTSHDDAARRASWWS